MENAMFLITFGFMAFPTTRKQEEHTVARSSGSVVIEIPDSLKLESQFALWRIRGIL
jgi:hypothetical protein